MISFGAQARTAFALEPGTRFLNHGSFGATPRPVSQAADAWRERMEANPDRFMRETLPAELRRSAARLAAFLHANAEDVVLVENATTGVNSVLRSLAFGPGDEILTTDHCYGAVRQALRFVCERSGAKIVEAAIPLPLAGEIFDRVAERVSPRTRLVVVDHIASPSGIIFPIERLSRLGVPLLVDGAHAPGQIALDVPAIGADWYVGNCHKWLFAPRSCGFLWARGDARARVHPLSISHHYGESFTAEFDWTGTRDLCGWLAVPDAIAFYEALDRPREHNHALAVSAAERLAEVWKTGTDAPAALHGSMMAVRLPDRLQATGELRKAAQALQAKWLAEHGIVAAITTHSGVLWCRLSAQIYNTPDDYAALGRL